jgi:hypothetical protein
MSSTTDLKDLRYNVMLALYLPILLYSFSTFDLDTSTVAVEKVTPVLVDDRGVVDTADTYAPADSTRVRPGTSRTD